MRPALCLLIVVMVWSGALLPGAGPAQTEQRSVPLAFCGSELASRDTDHQRATPPSGSGNVAHCAATEGLPLPNRARAPWQRVLFRMPPPARLDEANRARAPPRST